DGIRDFHVTGVQTCALPISGMPYHRVIPNFFEGHPGLQKVADKYVEYYQEQDGLYRSATMSLIDTREMTALAAATKAVLEQAERSEERRVGKECRARWAPDK